MSKVFVIDTKQHPLEPVHPGRARRLLAEGKAAVFRRYLFVIILKRQVETLAPAPARLKIDPGARTTGLALVDDATGDVVWAAEVTHRGAQIKKALDTRRGVRKGRRSRQTRYRAPRFHNRRRKQGWLPPPLLSRVENILSWVKRLCRLCTITALSQEVVRFDLQKGENSEISGVQYQQGDLLGYEVREFLLEKWGRTCAYCDAQNVPLEVEHMHPRAKGGTNRLSNLTLACTPCNQAKGTQDIGEFLAHDPPRLARLLAQVKAPLREATAVNATRWCLYERLTATGLPVETGSGGRTTYNRVKRHLPKTHWVDATCVGASTPAVLQTGQVVPLLIEANGRGHRRMMLVDKRGFPRGHRQRKKRYFGYQTGDLVRAVVPQGARRGTHVGRVAVKASGYFTIQTTTGKVADVAHRSCHMQQRLDGYSYRVGARLSPLPPSPKGAPVSPCA
ncbi:MAG: RNA-guided endonuclease IscB [Chloroflexota bacterium]|nr:RNA-guided endonuclease IscB [Chloroflexota bacterium]